MPKETKSKKATNGANLGFESKLWQAADALRNNMDAAEYKHVVLSVRLADEHQKNPELAKFGVETRRDELFSDWICP